MEPLLSLTCVLAALHRSTWAATFEELWAVAQVCPPVKPPLPLHKCCTLEQMHHPTGDPNKILVLHESSYPPQKIPSWDVDAYAFHIGPLYILLL